MINTLVMIQESTNHKYVYFRQFNVSSTLQIQRNIVQKNHTSLEEIIRSLSKYFYLRWLSQFQNIRNIQNLVQIISEEIQSYLVRRRYGETHTHTLTFHTYIFILLQLCRFLYTSVSIYCTLTPYPCQIIAKQLTEEISR